MFHPLTAGGDRSTSAGKGSDARNGGVIGFVLGYEGCGGIDIRKNVFTYVGEVVLGRLVEVAINNEEVFADDVGKFGLFDADDGRAAEDERANNGVSTVIQLDG
jgi:hypothetical protein